MEKYIEKVIAFLDERPAYLAAFIVFLIGFILGLML